ncbi:MAG: helix-turn-helix transcriptional regulator [Dehalococcoidia bacterium]
MPTSHDRPGALPTREFEFTPRQREVLDLLAAGRTNAQVADALGVSLDGAKWHVREILSILGVEGREDAAEYWRRHNGVPSRFRRTWRSFTSAGLALRLAAAAGGVVVVAGLVLAVLFVLGGGEDPEPAEPIQPSPTPVPPPLPLPQLQRPAPRLPARPQPRLSR